MMQSSDVRDWMKESFPEFKYYSGRMEKTQNEMIFKIKKSVALLDKKPVGNTKSMSYSRLAVNCIMHCTKNYTKAEEKANEVYQFLFNQELPVIGGYQVKEIIVRNFVDIGSDVNDIYEFALDFEIIYDRKAEKEGK